MKKFIAIVVATLFATPLTKAGEPVENFGIFDHVSVGVGFGILDGIGFEAAAPVPALTLPVDSLSKSSSVPSSSFRIVGLGNKNTNIF